MTRGLAMRTAVAGVAIGIAYVLSPLTVWFTLAMCVLVPRAVAGIRGEERRWVLALLIGAIVLRVMAVGALFLLTNHAQTPFGSFFGDEEYFIKRSIWLRNVALGIPIHGADLIYAFDEYSATSYLYVLAFIQVLVGPAPYGVHLLAIGCYVAGCALMFRIARGAFGRMPAIGGLVLLLFYPTQFAWSISALKDPLFFLLSAVTLWCAVRLVRGPSWPARIGALAAIVAIAGMLETVRAAGVILTVASIAVGLSVAALVLRPRLLLAATIAMPLVVGFALSRPIVQLKLYASIQAAARQHWGHIATAGYVYKLLDQRLYEGKIDIDDLQFGEAARFVVRAVTRYVTVPLPWEVRSTAALLYLPEQLLWYLLVALVPLGVVGSCRRDPVVGSLLLGYALCAALTVAMTSGNIGTLVRHRGLALPYIVWLSAVGACDSIRWWSRRRVEGRLTADRGPVSLEVHPTWP